MSGPPLSDFHRFSDCQSIFQFESEVSGGSVHLGATEYLIRRRPHPRACFFEQAQLQGLLGYDLLQIAGLTAQILDLNRSRCAGRVTR